MSEFATSLAYDESKLLDRLRREQLKRNYAKLFSNRDKTTELYAPAPEDWIALSELTDEQIRDMKDQGLPMPPCMKPERWHVEINLTEVDYRVELIVQQAASGKSIDRIAKQLQLPIDRVTQILGSPAIIARIRDRQLDMFAGRERSSMKDVFPVAYATLNEILADKAEKSSLRFQVAAYVIDQVIGRSQQSVEVKTNLLSDILEKLEQRDRAVASQTLDVSGVDVSDNPFQDILENLEDPEIVGKRGDRE